MLRRELLKYGAGLSLGAALPMPAAGETQMIAREVLDDAASPALKTGDLLVVDVRTVEFTGEGLYLYPDWGEPCAYQVSQTKSGLVFSRPGQPQALWTQTASPHSPRFAGRVLGVTSKAALQQKQLAWQPLRVPALPA